MKLKIPSYIYSIIIWIVPVIFPIKFNGQTKHLDSSSFYFNKKEYKKALEFYDIAIEEEENFDEQIKLLSQKYYYVRNTGSYHSAIQQLENYLKEKDFTNKTSSKAKLYNTLGYYYFQIGNKQKETESSIMAYKLAKEADDRKILGMLVNNLGNIYLQSGNYKKANEYFKKSKQYIDNNDSLARSIYHYNIAEINSNTSNYKLALTDYKIALNLTPLHDFNSYIDIYLKISSMYEKLMLKDSALKYASYAYEMGNRLGTESLEYNLSLLKLYRINGDYKLLFEAYNNCTKHNYLKTLKEVSGEINQYYITRNNVDSAYKYLLIHKSLSDSLSKSFSNNLIANFEVQTKLDSLNQANIYIEKEKELLKVEAKQSQKISILSVVLVISLVTGIVFAIKNYKKRKAILELELENKNKALHVKNRELIGANIELAEKEQAIKNLNENIKEKLSEEYDPEFNELSNILRQSNHVLNTSDRKKYISDLIKLDSTFYSKLNEEFPQLSKDDLRLAALIRLNLTTDELTGIFNISKASLNTKRYRLRKKLILEKHESLDDFIYQY